MKTLPSNFKLIKNFTKAVIKHVLDAGKNVTPEEFMARLEICNGCEMRLDNRCTHVECGCFLDKKAWWASEDCPMQKWPKLTSDIVEEN